MSILDKYNGSRFDFRAPEGTEWVKLKDLVERDGEGAIYPLKAMYINRKSEYGDEPVLVTPNALVNAPHHLTNTVNDMLNDDELIKYINDGYVSFTIYQYTNKRGTGYSVRWVDNNKQGLHIQGASPIFNKEILYG